MPEHAGIRWCHELPTASSRYLHAFVSSVNFHCPAKLRQPEMGDLSLEAIAGTDNECEWPQTQSPPSPTSIQETFLLWDHRRIHGEGLERCLAGSMQSNPSSG